jgi:hypothetical protein
MRILVLAAVALISLLLAGGAGADGTPLTGSVGPGFVISLRDASGAAVTHLDPGSYTLSVNDQSDIHNFHLMGPGGVDVQTTVDGVGVQTFTLNLVDGTYTFQCDAHPVQMKGSFTVGSVTSPPPPPPPSPPTPPAPKPKKLTLTVTDTAIALKNAGGSIARRLAAGLYSVTVVDRSRRQNAHLVGVGVNRKTGIAFVGTVTWKITLKAGKLAFRSDAASPRLRAGSATVS